MHVKVVCESTWRLRLGKTEEEQTEEESAIFFNITLFIVCLFLRNRKEEKRMRQDF